MDLFLGFFWWSRVIFYDLSFLNGLYHRHLDSTIGLGLKWSIIFIFSLKTLSKKSRMYALYKMRIKWPFFWVFMVNYGHLLKALISKQFRVQTHIWSGMKRSIIFIFSFNKSSKKSRNYAVYEMMLKWSFF